MTKRLIFLCVVLLSVYLTEQTHFLAKEHIQEINNVAKTWKAKQNFPPNTSLHQMKRLMGSILDKNKRFEPSSIDLKDHDSSNFKKIPKTFDARTHWSNCTILDDIPDQGNCGSCWAVATSSAFSDRVCIATKGEVNQLLSIEQLTFCCHRCGYGCFGGLPFLAWHYIEYHGLVTGGHYNTTDGCQPYKIPPCVEDEKGQNSCLGKPMEFNHMCPTEECYGDKRIKYRDNNFKTKKSYQLNYDSYQKEVLAHGPIVVTFMVYDDFVSYGSGVYYKTEKARELGGHAVKLIGWGEERGVPYWLCVNSWGPQWGDDGVFKIRRGVNECGIDAGATAGLPRVA